MVPDTEVTVRNRAVFVLLLMLHSFPSHRAASIIAPSVTTRTQVSLDWDRVTIPFIENVGQFSLPQIRFLANMCAGSVRVSDEGDIIHTLVAGRSTSGIRGCVLCESFPMRAAGAVRGVTRVPLTMSCWKGSHPIAWNRDMPVFAAVDLGEIAPGITLTLKAFGQNVEKLFVVAPGAKPADIRCNLEGAQRLLITGEGRLAAETGAGTVEFTRPVAYQENGGGRTPVEVAYVVRGLEYGFAVGSYDASKPLVIDPLLASTFLGGSGDEGIAGLVVSTNGSVYAVGTTLSSDFPATPGAFETSGPGDEDVFVSKFSAGLTNLQSSTYLGGSGADEARAVALGTGGLVYVVGGTESDDFPVTPGAYQETLEGWRAAFVACFDPALTNLLAATYLEGRRRGEGRAVQISTNGRVYVAGTTLSASFPATSGAYAESFQGWGPWSHHTFSANLKRMQGRMGLSMCGSDLGSYNIVFGPGDSLRISKSDYVTNLEIELTSTQVVGLVTGVWQAVSVSASNGHLRVNLDGAPVLAVQDTTPHILPGGRISLYSVVDIWDSGAHSEVYVDEVVVSNRQSIFWSDHFEEDLSDRWESVAWGEVETGEWSQIQYDGRSCLHGVAVLPEDGFSGGVEIYSSEPSLEPEGFVARLNAQLTDLQAATFLGGVGEDSPNALALGRGGRVHVAGETYSPDFPTGTNSFRRTFDGDWIDYGISFRVRVDAGNAGMDLRYAQGEGVRGGRYSVVFGQNHVDVVKEWPKDVWIVMGQANPTLSTGAWHQAHVASRLDGLVVSVDGVPVLTIPDRDPLVMGGVSFRAGPGPDALVFFDDLAITNDTETLCSDDFETGEAGLWTTSEGWEVVDDGGIYVLRGSSAEAGDWAWADTPWSYYDADGRHDGFVATLNADLSVLQGGTFLGGGGFDVATSVASGTNGVVYVGGRTESDDFPTTGDAYGIAGGGQNGFVSKLDEDLNDLQASTFLGTGNEGLGALALGPDGSIYVAGYTWGWVPTTWDAYDRSPNGDGDAFVSRLSGDLTALLASTLLGGQGEDEAAALAFAADGSVYVAGATLSSDFPTTTNAYVVASGGGRDGFLSKLDADLSRLPRPFIGVHPASRQFGYVLVGVAVTQVFDVVNTGRLPLVIGTVSLTDSLDLVHFKLTNDLCSGQTVDPLNAETCRVTVIFRPTNLWGKAVNLAIPSNDPDTPQRNVPLYGSGRSTNAAETLFQEGLQALTNYLGDSGLTSDLLAANDKFGQALAQNPNHYAAAWYRLITRLASLPFDSEVAQLLTDLGMPEEGRDLWNWTASLPDPLPPDSPDVGYAVGVLDDRLVKTIEEGLLNLGRIPTNWTGNILLSPEYLPVDNEVQVDAGDAQVVQGILSFWRGILWMIQSHDWHISFADLLNDDLTLGDHLQTYPTLGALTNLPRFARAAPLFVQAIDYYQTGSILIRAETDDQDDDMIIFDPDQLDEEAVFRHTLEQFRDSLNGTNASPFRFELSQVLNLKYVFTNWPSPRSVVTGIGAQQALASNILFQVERGLTNLAALDATFSETLTPDHAPVKRNAEVDYGDIALVRTCLQFCKALIRVAQAYDMDDVNLVEEYERTPLLVGDIPASHARFLGITNASALAAASNALSAALVGYQVASAFIRSEADDQADDLFVIQSNRVWLADLQRFGQEEDSFRSLVQSLSNSLSSPVLVDYVDHGGAHEFYETMHLGRFFTPTYVTRDHLPEFDATNRPVSGTFPDPTFNGLFPDMSQWHVADLLGLGLVDSDGLGLPDLWQLHYFGTLGHNPGAIAASGMTLYDEFSARTDPGDAATSFMLTREVMPAGGAARVQLRWRSRPYQYYAVEWTTNVQHGAWTTEAVVPATPYLNYYTNTVDDTKRKYYRVRLRD